MTQSIPLKMVEYVGTLKKVWNLGIEGRGPCSNYKGQQVLNT